MIDAQIAHACGLKYLVTRDKHTGKCIRVTHAMTQARLGKHEEIIEVRKKDPSGQAFTDLMNRAIDKPAEQPQQLAVGDTDWERVSARLASARLRGNE